MHFLFAWRYFKAKKTTNAINIIAWVSISAIVIGTTALILVLSVFNGFEDLVKSLYSSFYTDLKVLPQSGKNITVTQAQLEQLKKLDGIRNYSLVVEEKALLQNGEYQSLIFLKGVDDNYRYVAGVADHLLHGEYALGTPDNPQLILGSGIEAAMGVQADRNLFYLQVYLFRKSASTQFDPMSDVASDSIGTSASFQIQEDFDNKYGITNVGFAQRALGLKADQYTGLEIAINDPGRADELSPRVAAIFGDNYLVRTRYQQNQSLYSVMNIERWIIYAVLCLILVVAAFNMIGALTMLVMEKQKDIGILRALGSDSRFIQKLFLSEGLLLALIGTAAGMLVAFLICVLQINFHLIPLQGGSFLIDYFPVKMRVTDFLLVAATVFVIALIASWIPARKAARHEFTLRSE
ncbi:MAG: ABC transporter permease [Chitinophagaceae bacterium]|nr:MAG: ABC transporter permease [Chitinophagaceae bacterium]